MRLESLRRWAVVLDSLFRVPGTSIRFGLDGLIGLVPGVGDVASPIYTALILLEAVRLRIPPIVQARMVLNSGIDMLIGLVPFFGDLVDIAWKANLRNLSLLERHARPGTLPTSSDYAFVAVCLAVLAFIAIVPFLILAWLVSRFSLI